jgi:hypothetical protein
MNSEENKTASTFVPPEPPALGTLAAVNAPKGTPEEAKIRQDAAIEAQVAAHEPASLTDHMPVQQDSAQSKLLRLLPADKQAEAAGLILEVAKDARTTGEPIDPRRSSFRTKPEKYRRSARAPIDAPPMKGGKS